MSRGAGRCGHLLDMSNRLFPSVAMAVWVYSQIVLVVSTSGADFLRLTGLDLDKYYEPFCVALLLLSMTRYQRRACVADFLFAAAAFTVAGLVWAVSDDANIVAILLFMVCVREKNSLSMLRAFCYASVSALLTVVLMDAMDVSTGYWSFPNGYWVYGYGTGHANTMGYMLFGALASIVAVADERRNWLALSVVCCLAAFFSLLVLSCRTAFALEVTLAVGLAFGRWAPSLAARVESSKTVRPILAASVALLAFIMVAGVPFFHLGDGVTAFLDLLTNGRIAHGSDAYELMGGYALGPRSVLLPSSFEDSLTRGSKQVYVDSAYIRYALFCGLVASALFLATALRGICRVKRCGGSFKVLLLVSLYVLYCGTEYSASLLSLNCTYLYLAGGLMADGGDWAAGDSGDG